MDNRLIDQLIRDNTPCPDGKNSLSIDQLYRINQVSEYSELTLAERVMSYSFHEQLQCIIMSLVKNIDDPFANDLLHRLFTTGSNIGHGAYGSVISLLNGKNTTSDLMVVKSNIRPDNNILVEAMIGILGLNKLRGLVPNFSYIYGYFGCSNTIDDKGNVMNWCSNEGKDMNYQIIMENVTNSISISKFKSSINEGNVTQYYILLLQLYNALYLASLSCDFTHYDLNSQNILIQDVEEYVMIELVHRPGSYIRTRLLTRIIDYGTSHFRFKGNDYGLNFLHIKNINNIWFDFIHSFCVFMVGVNTEVKEQFDALANILYSGKTTEELLTFWINHSYDVDTNTINHGTIHELFSYMTDKITVFVVNEDSKSKNPNLLDKFITSDYNIFTIDDLYNVLITADHMDLPYNVSKGIYIMENDLTRIDSLIDAMRSDPILRHNNIRRANANTQIRCYYLLYHKIVSIIDIYHDHENAIKKSFDRKLDEGIKTLELVNDIEKDYKTFFEREHIINEKLYDIMVLYNAMGTGVRDLMKILE